MNRWLLALLMTALGGGIWIFLEQKCKEMSVTTVGGMGVRPVISADEIVRSDPIDSEGTSFTSNELPRAQLIPVENVGLRPERIGTAPVDVEIVLPQK